MKVVSKHIPKELFKKIINTIPICCVDIVFFNTAKDKILLCKRLNKPLKDIFYTNGGRLLKNETLEECALRQAKKELGISLYKKQLVPGGTINEILNSSMFGKANYHAVVTIFGCILDESTTIRLDNQHQESKWFKINDSHLHFGVKNRIKNLLPKLA